MLVNTWKVDMFNRPGLFVTTAVQCVLIGRLCAIMSTSITEMKASKTESLTELPLESCPKSCFSSLFFFRTGELHCLKNVQVDIEQKGRFAETLWRCNGPRGAKISNLDQNYPFSLAEVLSTLPAHSSAKDSQVHNLLRTRAWTRHWRWLVLTVESVAKGFQVGGS